MARLSAGFVVIFLAAFLPAQSPQTPSRGVSPAQPSSTAWKPKRRIVVTIGIDHYKAWPRLANAVSDATEVAQVLGAAGFLELTAPLLNESADKKSILHLLETVLPDKLEDDDDLVIFFAGHGASKKSRVGSGTFTSGYLIPADASHPDRNEWSDYLPLGELLESIGTLPARHVLLILDSCRSGVALGRVVEMSRGNGDESGPARVSRMVITSADADQDAADAGPVPGHSLFTGLLLKGLTSGDADLDKDGQITDAELALYLKAQVRKARSEQTPNYGQFLADNRGEMSFPKPDPVLIASAHPVRIYPSGERGDPRGIAIHAGDTRGPKRAVRQAIVIACDKFRDDRIFQMRFAADDARAVGQAFESLGYQVGYLINPTRAEVEDYLHRAVESASSSLGSLTFYFAGLGYADERGNRYLALSDLDLEHSESGLRYDEVQELLARSRAQQRVFLMDAEFTARVGPPDRSVKSDLNQTVASRGWTPDSAYGALLATRPGQHSYEEVALEHGVFSYFLIRGLRGDAAAGDGVLTLEDLGRYVQDHVRDWTGNRQAPQIISTADSDFPLGVVRASAGPLPPIPAHPNDIRRLR